VFSWPRVWRHTCLVKVNVKVKVTSICIAPLHERPQIWITQCYLQTTPYLHLPVSIPRRRHHAYTYSERLISTYYSFIDWGWMAELAMFTDIQRTVYPEEVTRQHQLHVMAQARESSPVIDRRSNHYATPHARNLGQKGASHIRTVVRLWLMITNSGFPIGRVWSQTFNSRACYICGLNVWLFVRCVTCLLDK